MKTLLITLSLLLTVSGCATVQETVVGPQPDDDRFAPPELNYDVEKESRGSLYTGRAALSLYQDRRAYRVGDILTVYLDEKTESKKSASSAFAKGNSVNFTAPTFGSRTFDNVSASLDAQRSFDGNSKADQGNSLRGSITVTVHEVYPNGVLKVVGEKWIKLNQGDEYIRLVGNVRVDDIDANNTLSSTRIADARITYAGKGVLADSSEPGWLTKFFNSSWMPF
ncbi:flagellar basal body L-ring protein FlgH [Vibrio mediterranei]|uniref:flagellar basal body L-ring protein FlgH n=1 Tax=Vibrio mediterranei TaxID=689 RepID=UPI00406937D4